MSRSHPLLRPALALVPALLACSPAAAAPGGPLGTLPLGDYVCETGGDATAAAGVHQPQFDFSVKRASSYTTATGPGIYLMTGDRIVFTSGPREGMRLRRVRNGFVRRIEPDGTDGELRCVRRSGSNF